MFVGCCIYIIEGSSSPVSELVRFCVDVAIDAAVRFLNGRIVEVLLVKSYEVPESVSTVEKNLVLSINHSSNLRARHSLKSHEKAKLVDVLV